VKRWILVTAALFVLAAPATQAGQLYVHVGFQFSFHNDGIYYADAYYDYDIFDFFTANVWGVATLNGSGQASQYFGPTMANHPDVASGQWDFSGAFMSCYEAHATAFEDNGTTQGAGSGVKCAYWQPDSYNVLISTNVDGVLHTLRNDRYQEGTSVSYHPDTPPGFEFIGWSGVVNSSEESITFRMPSNDTSLCGNFTYIGTGGDPPNTDGGTENEDLPCFPGIDVNCYGSPVIINFEKGDYRLTGSSAPVLFDMTGNGHPRAMGWTAAGADEAFLWLDRNHNGRVTSGAELFGNFTPLQNGQLAKNGFEALRELDTNGDGGIDEQDPIWSRLMLWKDLNHNGISEPNEILPIAGSGVISIDLHDHWSGRRDASSNLFKYESLVSITNGPGQAIRKHPVYDIFFAYVPYVP